MRHSLIIVLAVGMVFSSTLYAKSTKATLRLCFVRDNGPFLVSTTDKELSGSEGFSQFKETDRYMRKMKILIDGEPTSSFKPYDDYCISVFVPEQKHTVSVDFKSAGYSVFIPKHTITMKFKPDLLYKANMKIIEGPVASLRIIQTQNKIAVYQGVDNEPIKGCEKNCVLPSNVPVYFQAKSEDEKVLCPVQYSLVISNEREKNNECYAETRIRPFLEEVVKAQNIMCRVNVEYAFFKVYGEGCLVSFEPASNGINVKEPEIRFLPLEKQKLRYYISINGKEKQLYPFTADRKGEVIIPEAGDHIVFTEVRDM